MAAVGIVAEFNPFHYGHKYLFDSIRRDFSEDAAIVCAMSGSAVQRGELAVFGKYARAEAAVRCGADLVLELPCPWSLASAEGFARAGVSLLEKTGVVDALCFGSECGDTSTIRETARQLLRPEMDVLIRGYLAEGHSYARARQLALESLTGSSAELLVQPNNILAVEYAKAVLASGCGLALHTVRRAGAGHDDSRGGEMPSASYIRQALRTGTELTALLPEGAALPLKGEEPLFPEKIEQALLSRLLLLGREECRKLPGAGDGLGDRLYAAIKSCPSLEDIFAASKTKRHAMSRIRRTVMCAALGITCEDMAGEIPYIKTLAVSARGRALLRKMRKSASLPVLVRPSAVRGLPDNALRTFELESGASDLRALGHRSAEKRIPSSDWRAGPYVGDGGVCAKKPEI